MHHPHPEEGCAIKDLTIRQTQSTCLTGYQTRWIRSFDERDGCPTYAPRRELPAYFTAFLHGLFVDPEDGGDVTPKRPTFSELYCVRAQKTMHFIITAVRT
jgi:hypothetical protein